MNKLFHERLDPEFKPELKKSNEIALEFEGIKSRIDIDTSRNKRAGRSHTYQIVHKSESAYFQFPKEVNLGIASAVPDLPGTMIFDETTANGINFYFDEVQNSIKGLDGYDFVFIPWFYNPDYSLPTYNMEFNRTIEEIELCRKVKDRSKQELSNDQLNWRRFTIAHKCGGDVNLFKQEYPSDEFEAFIHSGRPRFDTEILQKLYFKKIEPIETDGLLSIYEPIDPLIKYVIGVDTSEGLVTGDNSSVVVLNARDYSVSAHYSGKIEPDALASYLEKWGMKFNEALIVIESNNHGLVTISHLRGKYNFLYYKKQFDQQSNVWTKKLGYRTDAQTKIWLIDHLDQAIRSGLKILVGQIIDELRSYVIEDDGKTNAAEGKHDDDVIALALAVQGHMELWAFQNEAPQEESVYGSLQYYEEASKWKKAQEDRKSPRRIW